MIEQAPMSLKRMSYDEAVLYCLFCKHDGYSDWRMPAKEENRDIGSLGWYLFDVLPIAFSGARSVVTPVRDV